MHDLCYEVLFYLSKGVIDFNEPTGVITSFVVSHHLKFWRMKQRLKTQTMPLTKYVRDNYYPLFMVRSWNKWNNGMRCMSFYIHMSINLQAAFSKPYYFIKIGIRISRKCVCIDQLRQGHVGKSSVHTRYRIVCMIWYNRFFNLPALVNISIREENICVS